MNYLNRPYKGLEDLPKIQRFIAENLPAHGGWHPGDFSHRLYNGNRHFDPTEIVRLWEDEQANLLGWVMLSPQYGLFDIQLRLDLRGGDLVLAMLDWVEAKLTPKDNAIGTDAFQQDSAWRTLLESRGYTPSEKPAYGYAVRSLADPIPDSVLPEGYAIRSAAGVHEADKLAKVHVGAFNSAWTADSYAQAMQAPDYDPEREIVVVAPTGDFAAFCIIWLDPIGKTGLFEPVGTHADYQRRGLGRAMMLEGLRRMQAAGLHTAIVGYKWDNLPAEKLYESVGLFKKDNIFEYRKVLA